MIASTINARIAMFGVVLKHHKIPENMNPLKDIRRLPDPNKHGRKRTISDDEFSKILQNEHSEEMADIYRCCRYSGVRIRITAIRLQDIDCDLNNEVINVPPDKNKGKANNKKGYSIPLDGRLFPSLYKRIYGKQALTLEQVKHRYRSVCNSLSDKEILELIEQSVSYLYPGVRFYGEKKYASRVRSAFKRACIKAGVIDACIHDLRRTAGTEYYNRTKDLYRTMKFLGHLNPNTTANYLHIEVTDLHSGVEPVIDNPLRKKTD